MIPDDPDPDDPGVIPVIPEEVRQKGHTFPCLHSPMDSCISRESVHKHNSFGFVALLSVLPIL